MAKDKGKGKGEDEAAMVAMGPPRLKTKFEDETSGRFAEKFGEKNPMAHPRLEKIVINVNVGRHLENAKLPATIKEAVVDTLTTISGQKPIVIKAKQSVSNFKVREGMETAATVTLRRERMWHFLDRLINLATPRIRDFRGLPTKSFDKAGNYSMGLTEQGAFPEIDMARTNFSHGMNINIVFSNSNPEKSRFVLEDLGMPFQRPEDKN
jgi:large subunit ribosomal protein L5